MKVKGLILSMALLLGVSSAWAEDNVSVVRPLTIKAGKTQKVAIVLENATAYTAFQMDIKLPTGLTLSNPKSLRTSDATFHNITASAVDGVTRVVALSYKKEADGSVLAGNGKVDTNDAINVIYHRLGKTPANFQIKAANVNFDKKIDTNDAIEIINIRLGKKF